MAITKQSVPINFSAGLDTKTDPFQVAAGRFLSLKNTVFGTGASLVKRNGFGLLASRPDSDATYLTTFNGNLTSVGTVLQAYSSSSSTWINKGSLLPCELDVLPLVRSSINQAYADAVIAPNGLICTVYTDNVPTNPTTTVASYKYTIADSVTGQIIVGATAIAGTNSGVVTYSPKVFLFGSYFIIMFDNVYTAADHLEFMALPVNDPSNPVAFSPGVTAKAVSSAYTAAATGTFDAVPMGSYLYVGWNGNDGGGAIRVASISNAFTVSSAITYTSKVATQISLGADDDDQSVYIAWYDSAGSNGYTAVVDANLNKRFSTPAHIISSGTFSNITVAAKNGVGTVFAEAVSTYGSNSLPSNFIESATVTRAGVAGTLYHTIRSLGLASKAVYVGDNIYFLASYSSAYQKSYFLLSSTSDAEYDTQILSRLAYTNGGGYLITGLPNVTVTDNVFQTPYLIKDLITSVNKNTNVPAGTQINGIYSQTGVNLASYTIGTSNIQSAEIGGSLNLTGGFLSMYDGVAPVEQNFFLYPDPFTAVWSDSGGAMVAQPDGTTNTNAYFYQVTYEWTDNSGNVHRSAPSVPVAVTTTNSGTSGSVTLVIPALRVTLKGTTAVNVCVYRWSVGQEAYYMSTSVLAPTQNNSQADTVTFVDKLADATILGNTLLYTTGGVLEDYGTSAVSALALFDTRLFAINAEDKNQLLFSKQVIENTPVEMSQLLTDFIPPTTGAEASTGPMRCIYPMDDKLIITKDNALYYINGQGPDITGANNQYSNPVFIAATVGCSNAQSIVLIPQGLMFQSNKGIWILGRDLSTSYIGSPVEQYNSNVVTSATTVPGTNQVRFTLDTGTILMYDYFYGQWGTFDIPTTAMSSTLYNSLHTYISSTGRVYQETPGQYLDGASPVLMQYTSSWFNLAGLQGYERAYWFYLLATYVSPHKINLGIAYDYAPTPSQSVTISPDNYNALFGYDTGLYGSGDAGGNPSLEQWQIFFSTQKCQSFQISMQEIFDSSIAGGACGAGFKLSGMNLVVGMKKGYKPTNASYQTG